MFPSWRSAGAGRVGLAVQIYNLFIARALIIKNIVVYWYIKKRNYENYNFLSIILLESP
jgi:hypothetical protein